MDTTVVAPRQPDPDMSARITVIGIFRGIGDQFIRDERYRDCTIGQDVDAMLGLDLYGAVRDGVIQVSTDLLDIDAEVETVRAVSLMNVLMSFCDGRDAVGSVLQMPRQYRISQISGLELEHARDDRQTILDPVRNLPEEHLLASKHRLETSFLAFSLDRHSQDVGGSLQKGQVMRDELVLGPAVDLQDPKRLAIAPQDDVHGAADAVLQKQFGGSKPLLVLKVIRDDGL